MNTYTLAKLIVGASLAYGAGAGLTHGGWWAGIVTAVVFVVGVFVGGVDAEQRTRERRA